MEVRKRERSGFLSMPPNYVSLNDLKESWLKKQAEIDARETREKAAAEAAAGERERREKEAVESRKRIEKVLVREVWWGRAETKEEGGSGERREKAPAAEMQRAVFSLGESERREKEARRSRGAEKLEGGNQKRREKAVVEATIMPSGTNGGAGKLEGGNWKRREKAVRQSRGAEKLEGGNRRRREKETVEATKMPSEKNGEAEKLEGGNRRRREKETVEATKMPSEKNGVAEKLEGGNWKRREKEAVEATVMPSEKNGGAEKLEGGNWKRRERKYKKNKGKAKADETLGDAAGKAEKVPETQREKVEEGGNRKRSEKVPEDPTVVMNGRVWVKKATSAVVDPRAEIECKFEDFSLREKNEGGGRRRENRKDETARKFDKKGGNAGNNSLGTRFRNLGKNIGYKALDSSLVWVRKEDKSDVCVAGNCSEGVLAKAGESEKKPGRGRP